MGEIDLLHRWPHWSDWTPTPRTYRYKNWNARPGRVWIRGVVSPWYLLPGNRGSAIPSEEDVGEIPIFFVRKKIKAGV